MSDTAARHAGIDRLKVGLTVLVLLHHTAITYGGSGGWFWRERETGDSFSSHLLTFFCAFNQSFFMGLFFLLAGAHVPAALARKGPRAFLRDRVVRLGIPLAVFGFGLGPVTVALAQTSRGRPFLDTLTSLWHAGRFVEGPLWFATALLAMSAVASLVPAHRAAEPRPFPRDAVLLAAALACGVVAFLLRLVWPVGESVWGLQFGYFAGYVILFVAGIVAAGQGWWLQVPHATAKRWRIVTWCTLPALLMVFAPWPVGSPLGGWTVAAVVYAFWEPFVAWGVVLTLLWRAQQHTQAPGPLAAALARRAFAVYVIHPPVLVDIALALWPLAWPPLVKLAVTGGLTCAACFLLAGLLLRVPGVARVL